MRPAHAVARVRLHRVRLPLTEVYASSMYMMSATHRTVIELETAEGAVGLGETLGTEDVFCLTAQLARRWLERDALDRRSLARSFARSVFDNRNGRNGWSAYGGLELAAWDLAGKLLDLPVVDLLGGATRQCIELACPLPAAALERALAPEALEGHLQDLDNVDGVVALARRMAQRYGFRCFKYKSAGLSAEWDLVVLGALKETLGADIRLRFDPNAAYPPAQALALCARLEPLGLECFEDPTDDLEGLAAIRARLRTPVATNMCLVQVDQLPAAIRRGAVDLVLADAFMWGGLERLRDLVQVADLFGLEVGVHSLFETGIGTAANLHLAAALPQIRRASDSGLAFLAADVVRSGPLVIRDGALTLPEGPGFGVELDPAALEDLTLQSEEISG